MSLSAATPARPQVSVVIPCYNATAWIGATIRSVQAQKQPADELIVVDDGSTDRSAEQVERQFPGVRVLRQANAGVAAARNHGVRAARHDWVAFVDADDIWLPDKLALQWAALGAAPAAQACYGAWLVWPSVDADPSPDWLAAGGPAATPCPGPKGWIYCDLLLDCAMWTSTVLLRRDLFLRLGGFDEALPIGEDYDLWLRLSRETSVARVDLPVALYRQHPTSLTRRAPQENWQAKVIGRALERWGLEGPDGGLADGRAVERVLARSWGNHAYAHLRAGNPRVAVAGCARALSRQWHDLGTWKLLARCLAASCGITLRTPR